MSIFSYFSLWLTFSVEKRRSDELKPHLAIAHIQYTPSNMAESNLRTGKVHFQIKPMFGPAASRQLPDRAPHPGPNA